MPPVIPAAVAFQADYRTGVISAALTNVDRLDRIRLEFQSTPLDEPALDRRAEGCFRGMQEAPATGFWEA